MKHDIYRIELNEVEIEILRETLIRRLIQDDVELQEYFQKGAIWSRDALTEFWHVRSDILLRLAEPEFVRSEDGDNGDDDSDNPPKCVSLLRFLKSVCREIRK